MGESAPGRRRALLPGRPGSARGHRRRPARGGAPERPAAPRTRSSSRTRGTPTPARSLRSRTARSRTRGGDPPRRALRARALRPARGRRRPRGRRLGDTARCRPGGGETSGPPRSEAARTPPTCPTRPSTHSRSSCRSCSACCGTSSRCCRSSSGRCGRTPPPTSSPRSGAASDTLVVVSTDLSHYLDDAAARAIDRATAEAITGLRPEAIGDGAACGSRALRGLVEHARRTGLTIERLALATSADTSGDRSRVVGYGAFAVAA